MILAPHWCAWPSPQDLPNNMVHQVRIKSLPQDWLWCESWCDDESKKTAKIIDLVRCFPCLVMALETCLLLDLFENTKLSI